MVLERKKKKKKKIDLEKIQGEEEGRDGDGRNGWMQFKFGNERFLFVEKQKKETVSRAAAGGGLNTIS